MSMKSVLVPMESHASMESVFRTAVLWRDDMTAILKVLAPLDHRFRSRGRFCGGAI
jgi:hypothetical protein